MNGSFMKVSLPKAYDLSNYKYHGVEQKLLFLYSRVLFFQRTFFLLCSEPLLGVCCYFCQFVQDSGLAAVVPYIVMVPRVVNVESLIQHGQTGSSLLKPQMKSIPAHQSPCSLLASIRQQTLKLFFKFLKTNQTRHFNVT